MERPRACRPFHLFDAMILVAAAAVAIFLTKVLVDFDIDRGNVHTTRWEFHLDNVLGWSCPSLVAATIALVIVRLRRPRPSLPRLCRQPGFCALGAVTAILFLGSLLGLSAVVAIVLQGNGMGDDRLRWFFFALTSSDMGLVVAAVWLVQRVSQRWRAERGWIDCCGRFLGFCWIVSFLAGWWLAFFLCLRPPTALLPPLEPASIAPLSILQAPSEHESDDRTDSPRPDPTP